MVISTFETLPFVTILRHAFVHAIGPGIAVQCWQDVFATIIASPAFP
jgi:hypothetical protein